MLQSSDRQQVLENNKGGSIFDLSAFLSRPVVNLGGETYWVSMSDDLKHKLNEIPAFKDKLGETLSEIQQIDYSKCPFKIDGFNLYLSGNEEEVYCAPSADYDW
jgi:hypothetical protein